MTIRQALQQAAETLEKAEIPDPVTDASLLLSHVTGLSRMQLPLHGTEYVTPQQEQLFASLLLSRASRTPLQYLLGQQCFYGLDFMVDGRVLIPRPETEALCELALAFLQPVAEPLVLDVCTGSGAIAITIAHECKTALVTATDISADALEVAQHNAQRNEVSVRFLQGNMFDPVRGERFHCILSNPPYIESAACLTLQPEVLREPVLALDGGKDGLNFYRTLAQNAASHLQPEGLLVMEIGDTQAEAVCALLRKANAYSGIAVHMDLAGLPRVVSAHAAANPT